MLVENCLLKTVILPAPMHNDIASILHHETTILSRLDGMARDIMRDYQGKDLTVVAILLVAGAVWVKRDTLFGDGTSFNNPGLAACSSGSTSP